MGVPATSFMLSTQLMFACARDRVPMETHDSSPGTRADLRQPVARFQARSHRTNLEVFGAASTLLVKRALRCFASQPQSKSERWFALGSACWETHLYLPRELVSSLGASCQAEAMATSR